MENKYYTPKIEEFHVGFEYEFKHSDSNDWVKYDNPEFNFEREDCCLGMDRTQFRVKYLDREDIESLGFDRTVKTNFGLEYLFYEDKNYKYCLYQTELEVIIFKACKNTSWLFPPQFSEEYKPIFSGTIKNKSELKRVMEQLTINKL